MKEIGPFKGEYSFLSNFQRFDTPMLYDGLLYPTNEHFYQAMKFLSKSDREYICTHPSKGLKGKVRDLLHLQRSNWEEIKLQVMEYGLRYKFSNKNPTLREKLIATGDTPLVEYNWWGDTFWGVDIKSNKGGNQLGKLLMKMRSEIDGRV